MDDDDYEPDIDPMEYSRPKEEPDCPPCMDSGQQKPWGWRRLAARFTNVKSVPCGACSPTPLMVWEMRWYWWWHNWRRRLTPPARRTRYNDEPPPF